MSLRTCIGGRARAQARGRRGRWGAALLVVLVGCARGDAPPPGPPAAVEARVIAEEDAAADRDGPSEPAWTPGHPAYPGAHPGDVDGDGVADAVDACPELPEDLDGFEDDDGCPDRDNDGDGIPDAHEWLGDRWSNCDQQVQGGVVRDCRNEPEDFDGEADHDGCWDESICDPTVIRDGPVYDPATLRFAEADVDALSVAASALLAEHPGEHLTIVGHSGPAATYRAAEERARRAAEGLRDALIRRGIPAERLKVRSHADGDPRESNESDAGRRANHRVGIWGSWLCKTRPTLDMECR